MNKYIKQQLKNILNVKSSASNELFADYVEFILTNTWFAGEIHGIKETKDLQTKYLKAKNEN